MKTTAGQLLAVITARGGSKALPRKNVLPLAGRPLILWTVEAALNARHVDRVIVSTDDGEIAAVARAAGAEVPFLRPAELATDTATSVDVLRHAVGECPGHAHIVLLQPTSPLRTAADIDAAFELMQRTGSLSCASICEAEEKPWIMYLTDDEGRIVPLLPQRPGSRRQDFPPVYRLNGAIYLAQTKWFLSTGQLIGSGTLGYVMPLERSVDIDTRSDFDKAELILNAKGSARPMFVRSVHTSESQEEWKDTENGDG